MLKPFPRNSTTSRRRQYFRQFFFRYNFRPEVDNDVRSVVAVDVSVWMLILGQTVFQIFKELISCRTNEDDEAYLNSKQEAHHKLGVGETPRRFNPKRCRYSSRAKFEDAFDL